MKKILKNLFMWTIVLSSVLLMFGLCFLYEKISLPDEFTVVKGESADIFSECETDVAALSGGQHSVDIKMLGLVPLKSVSVDVVDRKMLIPCGTPVGIYLETKGVLIIDAVKIKDGDGKTVNPVEGRLKKGDYITAVNSKPVNTKEELTIAINNCGGKSVTIDYLRNGAVQSCELKPARISDNEYKLGIWVRDNTQGVGMMTYVTLDGKYAALGHGINDADTNQLMEISNGSIYEADIVGIVKSQVKRPGELVGTIFYTKSKKLGSIEKNTSKGVFGTLSSMQPWTACPMQIAYKQDVVKGPASILTALNDEVIEYEASILSVNISDDNKGFVLEITDEELIDKTGGIIQGLSGSPVLQNGRIIGAVTHVFVNDPKRGYGIFIETMLEQ